MRILQRNVLIFSAFFHILAAIFSEGFHRPDEYLGVFQWMQLKLGDLPSSHLSWELKAQIRPWLHPYLFATIVNFCKTIGLNNPFHQATFLRILCSLLGMISIYQLSQLILKSPKPDLYKKIALLSLASIWFLPFVHARTTAESLGMSFFIFAYFLFEERKTFTSGLMLGLSFIFRFQMIFMIAPFVLWHILFTHLKISQHVKVFMGGLLVLGLSTLVDSVGYGNWTFTPYNYFYQNIILGISSSFGVDPWWKYFDFIFFKAIPPISILFIFCTFYHWVTRPFSLFSFCTIPFFIVHSLIAHKELRFIFPLTIFLPFFMAETLNKFPKIFKYTWKTYLYISLPLLIYSSLTPAHSPIEFYKYLYQEKEPVTKIYTLNLVRDQLFFYQKNSIELKYVSDTEIINDIFNNDKKPKWFLMDQFVHTEIFAAKTNCTLKYQSYSPLLINIGKIIGQEKRWKMWTLFKCD